MMTLMRLAGLVLWTWLFIQMGIAMLPDSATEPVTWFIGLIILTIAWAVLAGPLLTGRRHS
jgi:hypothetical protein